MICASKLCGGGIARVNRRRPAGVGWRNRAYWALYQQNAQALFTLDSYLADPAVREQAWRNRLEHPAWDARPNAGHRALVALERSGRLRAIVTQNIDGLHQRAGNDPARVIEIHGTLFEVECLSCGRCTRMRDNLDRVEAGGPTVPGLRGDPEGGDDLVRPGAQGRRAARAATRAAADCDLLLAVGTTLQVQPAAGLAQVAVAAGARLVIVNRDPTPYDDLASALLREPIGETLPRLVAPLAACERTGPAAASSICRGRSFGRFPLWGWSGPGSTWTRCSPSSR